MPKRSDSGPREPGERPADQGVEAGDPALSERLQRLNAALDKARPRDQSQPGQAQSGTSTASGMAMAFRLGSEFVAGVLVGAAIGWGIDQVLDLAPWGILVFTLIGFGAGVVNMMRAAGEFGHKRS
ncbi:AtpZ/AtpI family protein [Aquabacter spiritensis]|uniref:ATP synthase protein I n=1 Tax=Aquabacter spiritensis TaxID=933073 RepID=A0A4R3M1M2_9HYPH|nr:AtpZ/AtpI family protein [Aquabacter spiritensis]TCT06892.1 ATP synthase protein I [Aquabacter spiritensis]